MFGLIKKTAKDWAAHNISIINPQSATDLFFHESQRS